ncbi:hypothetical protein JCM8097_003220 [Rhodosporidiobolus ruineniae]
MAGILKSRPAASSSFIHPSRRAPRAASPPSDEPEDDLDDSEEDEWETERRGGRAARGEEDEELSEGSEGEAEGVAAYESDQGEMLDEEEEQSAVKQLAQIPFGMVLKAQRQMSKQNGKGKGKGKAREEEGGEDEEGRPRKGKSGKGKGRADVEGRSNKHAPTEVSSKKPVSRVRQIVEVQKIQARDPRFDSLSGAVRTDLFKNSYGFLVDKQRAELDEMRKTVAAAKKKRNIPPDTMLELEESLRRMENREVTRRTKEREQEAVAKWKREEKAKQKEGKKAFHLKNSAKKELFAKAKFDELSQDKRKLHKAMDKKRKKMGQKEKKLMPNARPGAGGGY